MFTTTVSDSSAQTHRDVELEFFSTHDKKQVNETEKRKTFFQKILQHD